MKKKICFIVSAPVTAVSFLKDHIKALSSSFDIYIVANCSNNSEFERLRREIPYLTGIKGIQIQREISIKNDLGAVVSLYRYFKKEKFDVVHSVTPKAGLITALAAKLAGIKHRIHIFTGQVWATRKGAMRTMLKQFDKFTATLDNHILVDGESQRQFLISEGIVSAEKSKVLGAGSICGANTVRYTPYENARDEQRKLLNIPEGKFVYCFMGRLNRDKGIYELFEAFNLLAKHYPDAYLLIFGNDEGQCIADLRRYKNIKNNENFLFYGRTPTPQLSLQAADVFCLPSYREGFGMSVIEASCLGLPVICSDAYGLADTMVDNETGLRCKVGDVESLKDAMQYFYDNPGECKRMGTNGRERVLELFAGEKIVAEWVKYYKQMLGD